MTFTNPYKTIPESEARRVTFSVSKEHKHKLKGVRLDVGTETICCTILYKKLVEFLETEGIVQLSDATRLEEIVPQLKLSYDKKSKPRRPA